MPATAEETGLGLDGVEILNVGTHNGHAFTSEILTEIAANFPLAGFLPALKVDVGGGRPAHAEGGPAFGFVTGLRTKGAGKNKILLARLEHIRPEIMEMIDARMFDRVSVEVHETVIRNGVALRNVLGAIELLGASFPAVPNLKPVSESTRLASDSEPMVAITPFSLKEATMTEKEKKELEETKRLLAEKEQEVKKLAHEAKEAKEAAKNLVAGDDDEDGKKLLAAETEKATKLQTELDALKAKAEGDGSEVKRLAQQVATLEESQRQARVASLVGTLKVKGGMVEELSAIATWATERKPDEVIKLAAKKADEKPPEVDPLGVVQSLIEKLNSYTAYMLKEHSTGKVELSEAGEPTTRDEASLRVDELAKKAVTDGKVKTYGEGVTHVLSQDSELKKLYTAAK